MAIDWEWSHQCIDKYDDIIDHDFSTKLADVWDKANCGTNDCVTHHLELWRTRWNNVDGDLEERGYALVVDGVLPAETDDGYGVPVRFQKEFAKLQAAKRIAADHNKANKAIKTA